MVRFRIGSIFAVTLFYCFLASRVFAEENSWDNFASWYIRQSSLTFQLGGPGSSAKLTGTGSVPALELSSEGKKYSLSLELSEFEASLFPVLIDLRLPLLFIGESRFGIDGTLQVGSQRSFYDAISAYAEFPFGRWSLIPIIGVSRGSVSKSKSTINEDANISNSKTYEYSKIDPNSDLVFTGYGNASFYTGLDLKYFFNRFIYFSASIRYNDESIATLYELRLKEQKNTLEGIPPLMFSRGLFFGLGIGFGSEHDIPDEKHKKIEV